MVVISAGAVGCGDSGGFKASSCGSTQERSKGGRLEGIGGLVREAAAEMVFRRDGVVGLDVVADGVFAEGQVLREVVGRGAGDVGGGGEIDGGVSGLRVNHLQDFEADGVDSGVGERDEVAGEGGASGAAGVAWCDCDRGVGAGCGLAGVRIVDLPGIAAQVEDVVLHVVERDVGVGRRGLVVGDAEEVAEEEELVLDDGAANGAAGVVVDEASVGAFGEVVAGVDAVVLHVLKGRSVETVGSGF